MTVSAKQKRLDDEAKKASAKQQGVVDARAAQSIPLPTPTPEEVHEAFGYEEPAPPPPETRAMEPKPSGGGYGTRAMRARREDKAEPVD